jgi:hypothetical protein
MKRGFLTMMWTLAMAAAVFAHGDKKHVIGTIEKLDSSSVTVKTREGKSVEVKLVGATTYVSRAAASDKPGSFSDLAVGENVVIHATPKGEELEADEVRFSSANSSPAAAPKSKP